MGMVNRDGRGSRTEPIVVEPPVLVPVMSADGRAETVAILTEILAGWWMRHYGDKRITDV